MDLEAKVGGGKRESVAARLERHPGLKERMERLLDLVENASGDVRLADEAERRAIEELRQMGQEVMQGWGQRASDKEAQEVEAKGDVVRQVKKTPLDVHVRRDHGGRADLPAKADGKFCRPFQSAAAISCRAYSLRLQRVITDFGADIPFARVPEKVREHYGIRIAAGAARWITEGHASRLTEADVTPDQRRAPERLTLIAESDGSMIPVVQTGTPNDEGQMADRRKTRKVFWKEAKLSMIRRSEEVTPVFAVTLGDAVAAGADLRRLAVAYGYDKRSRVHGLEDGATWIADQMEQQFGAQCTYHVDFYHVCDYLAAAKVCAANDPGWMERQKDRLKSDQLPLVMASLAPFQEPDTVPAEQAPVRACHRYLANRPDQFHYQAAIQAGLPIGSGEVESAHRYVIQKRLKLPDAWWIPQNAQAMLNLRVTRANGGWNRYWDAQTQTHAQVA